jgi:hypothetical protein
MGPEKALRRMSPSSPVRLVLYNFTRWDTHTILREHFSRPFDQRAEDGCRAV